MSKDKTTAKKPDFNQPAPDPQDDESDDYTLTKDQQEIIDAFNDDFGVDLPPR